MSVSIAIDHVVKKFGDNVIIPDLTANIKNGELFTLLGPSGCGKTTLLRMIAGFNSIEGGTIAFGDQVINDLPAYKRNIGMVFQSYAIFPHLTVRRNVEYGLRLRNVPKDEMKKRTDEMLSLVHIDEYQDRLPERLSGGQQQRVALARALVFHPPIVLMDEPLGALDKKLRSAMQLEIKRIQQKLNITTIYVTHDQEEALTLSDRIAIMRDGEIAQLDTAKNIYEHPNSSFIADFIGESNFVPVEIAGQEGEELILRIKSEQGSLIRCPRRGAQPKPTDDLKFVIRPEKVAIGRDLGPEAKLRGQVAQVIYLGETVKYIISIDGSYHFSAKEQTMDIRSHFSVGDLIDLTWNSENSQLLS